MHVLETVGFLTVCIWLYLLVAHGRFWMVWRLVPGVAPSSESGPIAAVIPARNEAAVIGRSVSSLLQQTYAGAIHIFVIDDNSTDATATAPCSPRVDAVTIIQGKPLPPGWSGKLWAMHQGIERALLLQPKYLLLTDADIQHSPQNIATLVAIAERADYDLTSFMIKLHCRTAAEKLLIPAFVFFFFLLYPPEWIRDPRRSTAGAAGGCMLIRPAVLAQVGGITALRKEIIDDCALAATVKRAGGKVWLGLTPDTCSLHTYGSFAEIERMIARTAFNQLRHSVWLLIGALAGLTLTYVLPLVLLASGAPALVALGVVAYVLMFVAYLPMVRFYGLNVLWALTLPFSAAFYMWATVHSALKYWSGRGGEWKGRAQDVISGD